MGEHVGALALRVQSRSRTGYSALEAGRTINVDGGASTLEPASKGSWRPARIWQAAEAGTPDLESEVAAYNAGFPRWQLYRLRRFASRFAKPS